MVKFRQKEYSEYDAMRELFMELNRFTGSDGGNKRFEIISKSYLPGILKGNSVVVEKFTSRTKTIGKDRYRMYIRVGAKAKMPDEVRLPKSYYDENLLGLSLSIRNGFPTTYVNSIGKSFSKIDERKFDDKDKKDKTPALKVSIQNTVSKLLGDAILYDKKQRLLILELDSVRDAANALNLLPFGLGYKVYLLD